MMYIVFDGVDSRSIGLYLTKPLEIPSTEEEIEFISVPGRAGSLAVKRGGYLDTETEIECYIEDIANMGAVCDYLSGNGELIESNNPTRSYRVTFFGRIEKKRIVRGMRAWAMTIPVRIKPFCYHVPAEGEITISASVGNITNPGTAHAAPRISITGNGDVTLQIGMDAVELTGLNGGVVIDSDLMECYNADGVTRPEDDDMIYMDRYPTLRPGFNGISWTGEGSISQIKILPRWRDR